MERTAKSVKEDDNLANLADDLKNPSIDVASLEERARRSQEAIESFVLDTLGFVKSPYDLNTLCSIFSKDTALLYRFARSGYDISAELNALYEERTGSYQELHKLEAAAAELEEMNKQLKKVCLCLIYS